MARITFLIPSRALLVARAFAVSCVLLSGVPGIAGAAAESTSRTPLAAQACGAGALLRDTDIRIDAAGVAQVLCPSIERVANRAIRLRNECRQAAVQWRCEPLGKEFVLEVNGRRASVLYPATLDSWAAFQMAQAITPMAVAVAQDARTRRMESCQISGDHSDLKVARMALRCRDWTVDFVRLCNASGCRHEPASRFSNARPAHRARG